MESWGKSARDEFLQRRDFKLGPNQGKGLGLEEGERKNFQTETGGTELRAGDGKGSVPHGGHLKQESKDTVTSGQGAHRSGWATRPRALDPEELEVT